MRKDRLRLLVSGGAALALVLPLGWFWQASLVPSTYSVMDMGYVDTGLATSAADHHGDHESGHQGSTSVAELTGPAGQPDVSVELVAREERLTLASGREIDGFTVNGRSPGPELRARQGDLVEVTLVNESVPDGVALHWHGIDVPNAEDGVAGVTQDAVGVGEQHTYRFVAEDAGTYWYHSHQVSHRQVLRGLLGAVVVEDRRPPRDAGPADVTALAHTYAGTRTLNGEEGAVEVPVRTGTSARVRVINTDNGPVEVWADVGFRVLAVDGRELNRPTDLTGQRLTLTAGGRADLLVTAPADGTAARVQVGTATALLVGPEGAEAPVVPERPETEVDLLHYGSPAPLGLDPAAADREVEYRIGRRPGFLDGRPGFWWSINGHLWPDVPMYVVSEGDVVRMRIENASGDVHPMHLHGHHAVVLSRDGEQATGSPWWIDSLNVRDGETFEIAFLADNPGVWMDHCHNLQHAAEGLATHLVYEGVSTPYVVGGEAANHPE
ncbi:MAG: Multicopper oxidase [uncultured Nocardioidaceae bacterium]|uniref:Multicopper oxidase n=1 Tax=uncultured Nocardioidaceae bacterium TaxID=253824 RepID=A0A6J4KYX2_9ACTN|nr:MAG: Multicopper oxidase [uncultured Nocardioidaceae bacterium]